MYRPPGVAVIASLLLRPFLPEKLVPGPPSSPKTPLGFGLGPGKINSFRVFRLEPGVLHDFVSWALGFLGILTRTPTCLGAYVIASLSSPSCTAYKRGGPRDLWPVPKPRWSWSGNRNPGAKRRRRLRFHTTALAMLSVIISMLNWLLLGFPKQPPPEARAGAPITEEQSAVQDRLLKLIVRFLRASAFDSETLGRCSEKFDRVAKFIQELPAEGPEVDLASLLHDLRRSFDPYSRPKDKPKPPDVVSPRASFGGRDPGEIQVPLASLNPALDVPDGPPGDFAGSTALSCKPLVASRIKWKHLTLHPSS